jgi:myo-inositol-1(or 4)-monophosphatase
VLATAVRLAEEAGALLLEGFGAGARRVIGRKQAAATKATSIDLVTEYDGRAEAILVGGLAAAYPGDGILAEEGGGGAARVAGAPRWLIDPLDGTTNFAHGLPVFAVSVARERGGVMDIGVVHAPALGVTFSARRGGGARCNGEQMAVSATASLGAALLATGFPYDVHATYENNVEQFVLLSRRAQALRRLGSAALDLALVAAGTYDGYWEMKLKPWDIAAGVLLVEEAGGRVSTWRGEPLPADATSAVATNGALHQPLLEALALLPPPSAIGAGAAPR